MASLGSFLSRVLDAFVDGIRPVVGRAGSRRRLVATETGEGMVFLAADGRKIAPIGKAGEERIERQLRRFAGSPVELRLAPDKLIRRTLQLPAAGREYLDAIVSHRLERLTPWRPDKVLYGFAVADETGADGSLTVEILATSTEIVEEAGAALAGAGLSATAVGSAEEPVERPLRIDLYRGSRDVGRARLRRTTGFTATVLLATLLPAAGAALWLDLAAEARLGELERRLATKRAVIQTATGAGEAESRDLRLIGAKRPETATTVLIARLSAAIPDDTYLKELEIEGATARLAGLSTDAAGLIGRLEADEALSGVRFGAPVTRDETGRDAFDITLTLDPLAAPAAAAAPGSETTP